MLVVKVSSNRKGVDFSERFYPVVNIYVLYPFFWIGCQLPFSFLENIKM